MQTDDANSKPSPLFMETEQLNAIIQLLCSNQHNEPTQLAIANLAKKLDSYACIWEKTPNLNRELQETLWTLGDIDRCLYTGQLYLIQARHRHAIEVFTEGLQRFSSDTPEYVLINKLMQLAKHRLKRFVDVIAQSPYDILSIIVSYLDQESRSVCADVSQTWRSRMLDCGEAWRVLDLSGSSTRRKTNALKLLPTVAQHIDTLTLHNDTKVNIKCIKLLGKNLFSSLQSLTITDHSSFASEMALVLYTALPSIAQTLTELRIIAPRSLDIELGTIITACHNLTSIECRFYSIADSDFRIGVHHHTLLKYVDLQCTKYCISVYRLQSLLHFSQHLRSLTLGRCQEDVLPVIGQNCPQLTIIISNINKFQDIYSAVTPHLVDSDNAGLQCLSLDPIYSAQPIRSRLEASCHSLRAMYLAPNSDDNRGESPRDWEPLASFTMYKLTHLSIDGAWSTSAFRTCLPAMLRCYPNIETLVLRNCFDEEEPPNAIQAGRDSIFNAMMAMKNLTCLDMMYVRTSGRSLIRFLQIHAMNESQLQKLSIVGGENMAGEIIKHAAQIPSLTELVIQNMRGLTTTDVMEFSRLLSQLPQLSILTLAGMKLKIGAARNIAACKCLSSLTAFNLVSTEEASLLLRNSIRSVKMF